MGNGASNDINNLADAVRSLSANAADITGTIAQAGGAPGPQHASAAPVPQAAPFPPVPPPPVVQQPPHQVNPPPGEPEGTRYLRRCNFCGEVSYWREGVCINEQCRVPWLH